MIFRTKLIKLFISFLSLVIFTTFLLNSKLLKNKILSYKINKYLNNKNFDGAILVAKNHKIILKKGYGYANYEKKILAKSDTIFKTASITKQFTATAIMMLEERGKLKLSDPVTKYIPDFIYSDKVTIHHLLSHTSGIQAYFTRDFIKDYNYYYSFKDIINWLKDKPLIFKPGSFYKYTNSNYLILGYIIEKISSMSYEKYIEENIFKPLKMNNSLFDHNKEFPQKAIDYYRSENNQKYSKVNHVNILHSAGSLLSTVEDLYKWDQALYTDKLLSKKTLKKMFTNYKNDYGYGWKIILDKESPIVCHEGYLSGFFLTYIYRNTESKNTIIILSNTRNKNNIIKVPDISHKIIFLLNN